MNYEIEQAVIGGLMGLQNKESDIANYALARLKKSFFENSVHAEIFKAIKTLANNDKYFDSLSVSMSLKDNELVGIMDVDRCYSFRSNSSTIRQHIEELRDNSIQKHALAKINDIADIITNKQNGTIKERLGLAESSLSALVSQVIESGSTGLRDGFYWSNKWLDTIEDFHNGKSSSYTLGFEGLDEILRPKGIREGSLVVVGARPKMGKTFFATRVAEHFASERGETCCIFSMEMGGQDIYERILSGYAKTNSNRFYTEDWGNNAFWDTVGHNNAGLANTKLFIDDTAGVSIAHIKSEVRKTHRANKVGLVVVDYLTLMGGDEKAERNDLKYGEITKQLKILGKELGCMILLLVQLNRGLENRTDKRPVPSDGRDTGQIEQDCDVWIGLYRERVYDKDCCHNLTEAIIRLNRAGDGGTGYMTLQNGYFESVNTIQAQNTITQYEDREKKENDEHERAKRQYSRRA